MKANHHHKGVDKMMILQKRKGMALITVVLIAALFLISIIGISAKVISEKKISNARFSSERALVAAETGLAQVLFNLRNADFINEITVPDPGNPEQITYISFAEVADIAKVNSPHPFPAYSEGTVPGGTGTPYVTYRVKIEKTEGDAFDPEVQPDVATVNIYSLGTVYNNNVDKTVLARKVVETECKITFNSVPQNVSVDYGILAGVNINFIGNSNRVFSGDIYAGGNIEKNSASGNQSIVLDGDAFAGVKIDDYIVPDESQKHEGAPPIDDKIQTIINDLGVYDQDMADAFKTGSYPYDGTVEGYPNTDTSSLGDPSLSKTQVDNIINDYLGDNNNLVKIASFYNDLVSDKITEDPGLTLDAIAFINNWKESEECLSNIVCYYEGDFDFQSFKDLIYEEDGEKKLDLGGVLIVDGDLKINSTVTINPDSNPLLIRVTGNVSLAGGAILNGNIFASGEDANKKVGVGNFTLNGALVTPRDIGVNGTFTCNGSLISEGSIDLNGTTNITFVDTGLGEVEVELNNTLGKVTGAPITPSSWEETSYDPNFWTP
jgi:hypothetical protein